MFVALDRFRDKFRTRNIDVKSKYLDEMWLYLALRNRKLNIVDLGTPNNQNLQFLTTTYSCRMFYAGFDHMWDSAGELLGRKAAEVFNSGTEFFKAEGTIDLILLWDLLSYVSSKQIRTWFDFLSGYCHRNTILYAMMPAKQKIPMHPGEFHFLSRNRLRCIYSNDEIKAQHYTLAQLLKMMPGFAIRCHFLYRNGMRECIFKFKGHG